MNIDQKSTKNQAKKFQKMDEIQAKTTPRDALVGTWPWRGPKTPPRHPQEGFLEASWGPQGPSWLEIEAHMAPSWPPKRSQNPSCGIMWASWERLRGILCPIFNQKSLTFRQGLWDTIFRQIFGRFCFWKSISKTCKNHEFLLEKYAFFAFGLF